MLFTIDTLRQKLFKQVFSVYEVFQNHFGEEYTDLQNIPKDSDILAAMQDCGIEESEKEGQYDVSNEQARVLTTAFSNNRSYIYVWWPEVTVTNENDRSINIKDLYARVVVNIDGTIPFEDTFKLARSTYPYKQFIQGYCHSHVRRFESSTAHYFEAPCLGTGPIRDTIMSLHTDCDTPLWMLFCEELSRYVTVESLEGVPYVKMEYVGNMTQSLTNNDFEKCVFPYTQSSAKELIVELLKNFVPWYLQHGNLSFDYVGTHFDIGMSYYNYMIDISNSFIEWFNTHGNPEDVNTLFNESFLRRLLIAEGRFYKKGRNEDIDTQRYEGTRVLSFKERDVLLHIEPQEIDESESYSIILSHPVAMCILDNILNTINYYFINEYNISNSEDSAQCSSQTNQTAAYI